MPGREATFESSKGQYVASLFDKIANNYNWLNKLISLGLDQRWRRFTIDQLSSNQKIILDIGCGPGDLIKLLEEKHYVTVGLDPSINMLMLAQKNTRSPSVLSFAEALPFKNSSFSAVVSAFALRNLVDVQSTLNEVHRVLMPGGEIVLMDIAIPKHVIFRVVSRFWFNFIVPLVGGLFSDYGAYRYLPRSFEFIPSEDRILKLVKQAGFTNAKISYRFLGNVRVVKATKQDD